MSQGSSSHKYLLPYVTSQFIKKVYLRPSILVLIQHGLAIIPHLDVDGAQLRQKSVQGGAAWTPVEPDQEGVGAGVILGFDQPAVFHLYLSIFLYHLYIPIFMQDVSFVFINIHVRCIMYHLYLSMFM